MNVYEEKGCITYKDREGNLYRLFPMTKVECIDGMSPFYKHLENTLNPHGVDVNQIGAIPVGDIASKDEVLLYLGYSVDTDPGDEFNNMTADGE